MYPSDAGRTNPVEGIKPSVIDAPPSGTECQFADGRFTSSGILPVAPGQNGTAGTWTFQMHGCSWTGIKALCRSESLQCAPLPEAKVIASSNELTTPNHFGECTRKQSFSLSGYTPVRILAKITTFLQALDANRLISQHEIGPLSLPFDSHGYSRMALRGNT